MINTQYKLINSQDVSHKLWGHKVYIYGWIEKVKKISSLYFITLRDCCGKTNLIYQKKDQNLDICFAKESVFAFYGLLKEKKSKESFSKSEIKIDHFNLINSSLLPKFKIEDETDGLEKIRLQYRYLDLRRPKMRKMLWTRHLLYQKIRNFFNLEQNFLEIDTPILASPTIEGARSFLVNSSFKKDYYYALPQSPQLYKQLLMASGVPNYFQICHCFRDENMREDRQPEFMQLDVEMNFKKWQDVINLTERLIKYLWKELFDLNLNLPFDRIDYHQSFEKYGSDKPDLRFDLTIQQFVFGPTSNEQIYKGFFFEDQTHYFDHNDKDHFIKILNDQIIKITHQKILYCFFFNDQTFSNLDDQTIEKIKQEQQKENNKHCPFWIGFVAKENFTNLVMAKCRQIIGKYLINYTEQYRFCWVINPNMFQYDPIEKKWKANHHPFCQPQNEQVFWNDYRKAKINGFDLVCNGLELGSGSERVFRRNVQEKIFEILKIERKDYLESFGFLLEAMSFGYPFHSGIALGLDRLMMIITNDFNIRNIIAFPKTSKSTSLLTKIPKKIKN